MSANPVKKNDRKNQKNYDSNVRIVDVSPNLQR